MSAKKFSLLEAFIWLIVITLILLLASPIAVGFLFQDTYQKMLTDMSESAQLDISIVNYERGLYTSDVILQVSSSEMPMSLQFEEQIIHGPLYLGLINQSKLPFVLGVVKGNLVVPPDMQAQANTFFNGQAPLQYQQIIDFSGVSNYQLYMPAIDARFEEAAGPVHITSSGMLMNGVQNFNDKSSTGELSMPGLAISGHAGQVTASELKMNFAMKPGQTGLFMGDSNVSLKQLDVQTADEQFALHDFRVSGINSEVGRLVNSNVRIQAREIYASNERFGPVTFNLTLNGLNADSLLKIQQIQKQVSEKREQGIPPEQINAMIAGEMIGLVPDLIKQADVKINPLKLESELGVLETTLNFSVEGLDNNAPADPFFLLGAINLDVESNIDQPLMNKIIEWRLMADDRRRAVLIAAGEKTAGPAPKGSMDQRVKANLKSMLSENWLRLEEGVYRTRLSMHQGQMELNGLQVNPMQLMQQGAAGAVP